MSLAQPWPLALTLDYVLSDRKQLPGFWPESLSGEALLLAAHRLAARLHKRGEPGARGLQALHAPEARPGDRLRHARGALQKGARPRPRLPRQEAHRRHDHARDERRQGGQDASRRFDSRDRVVRVYPARDARRDDLDEPAAHPARAAHRPVPLPRRSALPQRAGRADAGREDQGGRHSIGDPGGRDRHPGGQDLRPRGRRAGALPHRERGLAQGERRLLPDRGQVQHRARDGRRRRDGGRPVLRGPPGALGRPLRRPAHRLYSLPRALPLAAVGPEPAGEPDRQVPRLGGEDHRAPGRRAFRQGVPGRPTGPAPRGPRHLRGRPLRLRGRGRRRCSTGWTSRSRPGAASRSSA